LRTPCNSSAIGTTEIVDFMSFNGIAVLLRVWILALRPDKWGK